MAISTVPNAIGANVRVPNGPSRSGLVPSYIFSGPGITVDGNPPVTYELSPTDLITSDTITFSDGGAGGTFTPTSLTFTNTSTPQSFTYQSPGAGTVSLTPISGAANPFIGSPISLMTLSASSLNIQNNVGTWRAQTASDDLALGQSQCWVSFFIQYISTSGSLSGILFNNSAIQVSGAGTSIVQYELKAASGSNLSYNHTFSAGVTYHVAMVWNSGGTSTIYINGSAVTNLVTAQPTLGTTGVFSLGVTSSQPNLNWLISDLAIGNGGILSKAEVVALAARDSTPIDVSTPATAWWTLYGTGGDSPVASAGGLVDVSGNSNDLDTVAGSNAVYSSTVLDMTPLIELATLPGSVPASYVDMTGNLIYFLVQTATSLSGTGAMATATVTAGAVSGITMVSLGSGYTSIPFVFFMGGGGTGAWGIAVLTGDQITDITIKNPGRGYTSSPIIVISAVNHATVTAVNANPTISKNGTPITLPMCVNSISLVDVGTGYTTATVTITPGAGDTTGIGAKATATVSGGAVTTLKLTKAGGGYTAIPTVTISGDGDGATGTAALGPFWPNVALTWPMVAYQLPTQALDTDVFTFTAPTAWLLSGFGPIAGATDAPIANFAGQLEPAPVGWGLSNFGDNLGVMSVGMNAGWPTSSNNGPYYQAQNWLRRVQYGWSNTLGSQAVTVDSTTGHPTSILSSDGHAYGVLATLGNNPVLSNQGFPMPTGTYTLVADESDSVNPMSVTLTANTGFVITGGTPVGTGVGKTWQWQVGWAATWPISLTPSLQLNVFTPTMAAGPWTLSNEWFSPPNIAAPTGVGGITMIGIGSGYTAPTFAISGGGGSGATAVITAGAGGLASNSIAVIRVTDGGINYTSSPTVVLTGGSPTVAAVTLAIVASGSVTHIVIYDPGYGYGSIPTVALNGGGGTGATAIIDTLANGVIRSITMTGSGTNYTAPPTVAITDSTGSGAVAMAWLASPAQTIDRTNLQSSDMNVSSWMSVPNGNVASWIRMMDSTLPLDAESNVINASDLKLPGDFTWSSIRGVASASATLGTGPTSGQVATIKMGWGGVNYSSPPTVTIVPATAGSGATAHAVMTGDRVSSIQIDTPGTGYVGIPTVEIVGGNTTTLSRNFKITQLGPYTPTPGVHDKVFVSDNWPGTVASSPGDPLPYVWTIPSGVGIYYMDGSGLGSLDTQYYVGEATTAEPHGLNTGLTFSWAGDAVTNVQVGNLGNVGSPATINLRNANRVVSWVTGPNTFSFTMFGGGNVPSTPGAHYGLGNIISNVSVDLTATVVVPDPGTVPYEVLCEYSYSLGSNIHVNVPASATIDCIQTIATRVLNSTSPDVLVGIEYTNEHWDVSWPRNWFLYSYATLQHTGLSIDQFYTMRAAVVHDEFQAIFDAAGRGKQIIRLFGGRTGFPNIATSMINYAASVVPQIQIDVILVSSYPDPPGDLPFVSAAASLATGDNRSVMFGSSFPWTRPMQSSIIKHDCKYRHPSGSEVWADQANAIATYNGPTTAYGAKPAMACYETAVTEYIQAGIDATSTSSNITIRSQLTTDMQYDPSIYWAESASLESTADHGNTWVDRFSLCAPHSALGGQDANLVSVFGAYACPGQYWGRGDGSDGRAVNLFAGDTGFTVGYDLPNVSVIGQAWRDWAQAANGGTFSGTGNKSLGGNMLVPNAAGANSGIFGITPTGVVNSIGGFGITGQVLANSIA